MEIHQPVVIYISAASDLMAERETLARMIAELPVTLVWRVIQSPLGQELLDLEALQTADLHLLLMGGDIRAPVGHEWYVVSRAGRPVTAFLKQGVSRTPAGQAFMRDTRVAWQPFSNPADLSRQVRRLLAGHLVHHAGRYALSPSEIEQLIILQREQSTAEAAAEGAGRSAVILSRERFTPGEGVIIDKS
jgi:hypothetical protein